jgi:membrane protein DedA with SNARE-associated domain/membrane-associated phospholipid phosphatase
MSITDTIITFASDHPYLIGLLILVSAFLEAIPFVGSLFPGSATVMVLSGAVGASGGALWPLVAWGGAGGFIGDILGYWIGRRYGVSLREVWPFATRPALWEGVARVLNAHGGKSVVVSRFLPGARAVTPIAAGALGMRIPFFVTTSVIAALAWALVYVVPAAVLGQLLSTAGQISARLVGAVLTIIIALMLVIWLARFAATVMGPRIYRRYREAISRMENSSSPLARRIGALLDPALAAIGPHLLWGTVLLVSAIGLFGIIANILASTDLLNIDDSIRAFASSLRSTPIDFVMVTVTAFGEGWVIAISAAILALMLLIGRARRTAAIVGSVFAATFVFLPIVNALMRKEYPVNEIHPGLLSASFPSSHATLITLFCGVLAALATPALGSVGRMVAWSLAVGAATLVGISRIYLDALWPSDVAGGLLLGLALTAVFAMIRTGFESELGKSLRYPLLACLVFLIVGGGRALTYQERDIAHYAPRREAAALAEAHWLSQAWQQIPQRRLDLLGKSEETISLQVAADPRAFAAILTDAGWKPAPRFQPRDLFLFFSPTTPLDFLPPLPLMESGRLPAMTFVRAGRTPDRREVIRLWPTNFAVRSSEREWPLLVGAIADEKILRPYDALTTLDTVPLEGNQAEILNEIVRRAGPQVSVFERRGPRGPVLLIAPYRAATAVGSILVRQEIALRVEERGKLFTGKARRDGPALSEGFAVEPVDDQVCCFERAFHPIDDKSDNDGIDNQLPVGKQLHQNAAKKIVVGLGEFDEVSGAQP